MCDEWRSEISSECDPAGAGMPKSAKKIAVLPGGPEPLGACVCRGGVNFALFSHHASRVRLELFDHPVDPRPASKIDLDPSINRTGDVWHVLVKGLRPGQLYAYRVDGPYVPQAGHRFNFKKLLLDPYAKAITPLPDWDFGPARGYGSIRTDGGSIPSRVDNAGAMPKCVVTGKGQGRHKDKRPRHPWSRTVIYETHLRGFTAHNSSGVKSRGTYRGLTEKIPYLKKLGVTALELMPVMEFNESQVTHSLGRLLKNYWGYDPVGFFAPKASYSSSPEEAGQEFRKMVRAFHKAGIEIILDVVFNHTAETDQMGPTISLRGIDNAIYYILDDDKAFYKNISATGNTVNAGHPVVQDLILSSLRYWAEEMQVDGFRFDLAAALARDPEGALLDQAPLLERIAQDPVLKDVKLIAEPWDGAGGHQTGSFSGPRWSEWNDRFRDDVRRFWRGDDGTLGVFASRICGSSDIFARSGKGPHQSVNFITSHDGFTLNDLVSYREKHNEANLENNEDGTEWNFSENYGVEGETDDRAIKRVRTCQIKNFLLTLFVSRGVPMLLGGDEFRRSQQGNNNPYCQDNEISWYDWGFLARNKEIFNFTRGMIVFRAAHPVLSQGQFYTESDVQWYGTQGRPPDWADPKLKQCACLIREDAKLSILLVFNSAPQGVDMRLPALPAGRKWYLASDTSREPPRDLFLPGKEPLLGLPPAYHLNPRSSVILLAAP